MPSVTNPTLFTADEALKFPLTARSIRPFEPPLFQPACQWSGGLQPASLLDEIASCIQPSMYSVSNLLKRERGGAPPEVV
jgi:hypothetical protein